MEESSKIRHKRHSDLPFTEEAWAVSSVVEHLTFNQGVVGPTPTPLTSLAYSTTTNRGLNVKTPVFHELGGRETPIT